MKPACVVLCYGVIHESNEKNRVDKIAQTRVQFQESFIALFDERKKIIMDFRSKIEEKSDSKYNMN